MARIILINLFYLFVSFIPAAGQDSRDGKKRQENDTIQSSFSLFESDKLLGVSLHFDLTAYLKRDFKKSLDGFLTIHLNETDSLARNVKVKNRGIYRSKNCTFPPMEISFKKAIGAYPSWGKISKLKLVTRCESGSQYDEYVLREYLVYKLYNILTDTSFRVRLLRMDYIDSQNKKKPMHEYGFFIEPKEILAERTNSTILKTTNLNVNVIIPEVMDRVAVFNYMISNYDWSVAGQHNISVYQPKQGSSSNLGIAVPFDFDGTGVVNAVYAVPLEDTGLKSIRDRVFLGPCRSKEVYQKELQYFLGKKDDCYRLINDFPYLEQKAKKDIIGFLNEFFSQIEKQNTLDRLLTVFMNKCK